MTDEKKTTPAGMSEATAKFEHTDWSAFWQDWQRGQREEDHAGDAAEDAVDTLPEWAKEVRRKRAGYEDTPPDTPARRAAAELDTPEYRAASAGLDAAKQRYSDLGDALGEIEERILATPALTPAGALVKMRIGIRGTLLNYLDSDGRMPEESEIDMYDRMLLAVLADLESLAGPDIGPNEIALGQGHAETSDDAIEPRQDEQSELIVGAVVELEGKRIDPKEWASHIPNVNIAMAVLAQDPPAFENRLRETMSPDASEWGEAMDGFESSKVYLESVATILNTAHMRVLLALSRIAGVDEDEDTDPAGPDNSQPKGESGLKDAKGAFLTLVEELDDIKDVANNMVPGAAYYVLIERAQELDEEMLETRPETLAGVVWKLKELTRLLDNEPDISVYDCRLAHSVMADVETLAAGQAKQV